MSIYYLGDQDFEVKQGHLCCKGVKELTLVFFSSPDCPNCQPILPLIQQLSQSIQGCGFAIVNIKQNYNLSLRSRPTSTPIKYVPYTILYYRGVPYQQFKSTYTRQNLQNFIMNAGQQIKTSGQRQIQPKEAATQEKEIPAYTTGIPYCDEESGVCYLNFDKAYKS